MSGIVESDAMNRTNIAHYLEAKMKRIKALIPIIVMAVLLTLAFQSVAEANSYVTFLNPPPDGLLELEVGESYTFEVLVEGDRPFISALLLADQYYPGRGIFFAGNDIATRQESALLTITVTGKNSTSSLPGGVAPAAVVVGVRYSDEVIQERFDFFVTVP